MPSLSPFDKPLFNSILRGVIFAGIAAGGWFFKDQIAGHSIHDTLLHMGDVFFTILGVRVVEGAVDQQNPVQREADTNK